MKKYLLIVAVSLELFSCGGGSNGSSSGNSNINNKINLPGNLSIDTNSINTSDVHNITITNSGQSAVTILSSKIVNDNTLDTINSDNSTCNNKTLYANQTCVIALNIGIKQSGVSNVQLNTNIGVYNFPITVNTSNNDILSISNNIINTTKEVNLNIYNNSNLPITIKSINTESDNSTLTIKDNNCINNIINPAQSCSIIANASPNIYKPHIIKIETNNKYLATQELNLTEATNITKLSLFYNDVESPEIKISKPDEYTFMVKNSGTNLIHLEKLNFDANHIGQIINTNCDNVILQANDFCNITLKVNDSAYGLGNITAKTLETLASPINYTVNIINPNLLTNGVDSLAMYNNANKKFEFTNTSNYTINVNEISFDNKYITLDSNCSGIILPNGSCIVNITSHSPNPEVDTSFIIKAFDGNFNKSVNLHIGNNVSINYENAGTPYYSVLPKDNNLYQVFTINNPTNAKQVIDINSYSQLITLVTTDPINGLPDKVFWVTNCINPDNSITVDAGKICEIIVKATNNLPALQDVVNQNMGRLRITVNYAGGGVVSKTFKATLITSGHHIEQNYVNGYALFADEPATPSNCGMPNSYATIAINGKNEYHGDRGGGGVFPFSNYLLMRVNISNNNNVIFNYYFSSYDRCNSSFEQAYSLQDFYPNDTLVLTNSDYHLYILSGSSCSNGLCNITLKLTNNYGFGRVKSLTFNKPIPSQNWVTLDNMLWNIE